MKKALRTRGKDTFLTKFAKRKLALISLILILVEIVLVTVLPPLMNLDPYSSTVFNAPPGTEGHLLGTDDVGRDLFARLVYGGRVSLMVGLVSTLISIAIGLPLGLFAGYYGGVAGNALMRIADVFQAFPSMILIMVIVSITGPSIAVVVVVIGVIQWTQFGRLVYSNVLSVKKKEYVEAARTSGVGDFGIMFRYILPNAVSPVWMAMTNSISFAILIESALSFLGLGVQSPKASWGNIMNAAQSYVNFAMRPWVWLSAGLCIVFTVIIINFVGDGVRSALDPNMK